MALDIVEELIKKIDKVDISKPSELFEFSKYVFEFKRQFNAQVTLNIKKLKEGERLAAEDFSPLLSLALIQAVQPSEGEKLLEKIQKIDDAVYSQQENFDIVVPFRLGEIELDDVNDVKSYLSASIQSVQSGFENAQQSYKWKPPIEGESKKKFDRIAELEKLEKLKSFLEAAELKIAKEMAKYQATQVPEQGFLRMSGSRATSALDALVRYKEELKETRGVIKELDTAAQNFQEKLDEKLIELSKKTEACYNHPAIKKAPSTHRLFQWILDGMESMGLYRSKASQAAVSLRSSIDACISEGKKGELYTSADRKAVQEVLLLDNRIEKLNNEKPEQVDESQKVAFESLGIKVRTQEDIDGDKKAAQGKKESLLTNERTKSLYNAVKAYDQPKLESGSNIRSFS